ncbi:MAG: DNA polymerase III subunit delta [Chloroflexota bacterium]|nr:DNA polymerase III subunit delta [Chloroflexota bacterium]
MTIHAPATGVPPYVLVSGPEGVLAERAVASTVEALRVGDSDLEVIKLYAEGYQGGTLTMHASPSLFGGSKVIVVHDLDDAPDELQTELLDYLHAPADEITLVVVHKSGMRGKKVLDTLKKAGARVIECPLIKSDGDKAQFASNEFRRQGRRAAPEAVRALVEAVGKDLRELAAACAQMVADTEGLVDEAMVQKYHGGRVEATGFKVADAAIAGNAGEALRLLRHAIQAGDNPVPIVAVLAMQLRQMVRVGSAGRGASGQLAKTLALAPWQIDQARRKLNGWGPDGLGRAIQAVAAADFDVKGGGRDPVYAVERAILTICDARNPH